MAEVDETVLSDRGDQLMQHLRQLTAALMHWQGAHGELFSGVRGRAGRRVGGGGRSIMEPGGMGMRYRVWSHLGKKYIIRGPATVALLVYLLLPTPHSPLPLCCGSWSLYEWLMVAVMGDDIDCFFSI